MQSGTITSTNPLVPDNDKNSLDFGLKVLRGCYAKWKNGYGGETYSARFQRFERNRLYAAGKQPTEQYRDIIKIDGQQPILNLDYSALGVAIPMLESKADRYLGRIEKIRCKAAGPVALSAKNRAKEEARFKMNYAPAIQELQQGAGMQLEDFSDDDPKSAKELEIKFETTYKTKLDIIMQMGINMVFEQNDWSDTLKRKLIYDVFNCGFAVTHTDLNGNGWIKTPVIRPETFITSYSEMDDFADWQWQGHTDSTSIYEIRLKYPNRVSEEQLFNLSNKFRGKYGNPSNEIVWQDDFNTAIARPYDSYTVEVVNLYYKTLNNLTYRKVTNSFGREVLYEPKEGEVLKPEQTEKSKPYYVTYHGLWIIDTDIVLEWGLAKNMLKPNNNLVEIRSPYTIYMYNNNKCRNTPLVETMIPFIDLLQNIHMQTQKIIAMTAPDGFNIDMLGISDVDMGEGQGIVSPMQLFGIYLQTGNQYYKGSDLDDPNQPKREPPIQERKSPISPKLAQLEAQWQATYQKLQLITGDNNLASGIITNQATANSTLNDAREIADSASNYVYKAVLSIHKGTAKNVEILLLDKFFLHDDEFDGYTQALGEDDIRYIRTQGESLAEIVFDTTIQVDLDGADQEKWDRRVEIALEQGQITIADVAELELIDDPVYRSFMLAQKAKEKMANDMAISQQNSQDNTKAAVDAADAKGGHDMNLAQTQHQQNMELEMLKQSGEAKKQDYEFSGILKSKVAEAILAQPGATWKDIPDFIWAGLNITNEAQKQVMFGALQQLSAQNQQMQQAQAMQQLQARQQPQQVDVPEQGQQSVAA